MKRAVLTVSVLLFCVVLAGKVLAQNKVVVIPLGVTVGTVTRADAVKGKTFSSQAAGEGARGNA